MLHALAELTLRGTALFALIGLVELALARHMHPQGRRAWWWLVAIAFLLPLNLDHAPRLPPAFHELQRAVTVLPDPIVPEPLYQLPAPATTPTTGLERTLVFVWAAGCAATLGLVLIRTARTQRRWARQRLSTDAALLSLLEDAKASARVSAPIGLVVSHQISAPALLGWLRPRILLPAHLVADLPPDRIRAVLLHELAHFRSIDLALHWAFTLVSAVHWFNPFAHLAARRWLGFREVAADASALGWLPVSQRFEYGETLLAALRHAQTFPPPAGALALGESLAHLKHRIVMIARHPSLLRLPLLAFVVSLSLASLLLLQSARADETANIKDTAVAAMNTWLADVDHADYGRSWDTAAEAFKKAITRDAWIAALKQVRAPLGSCTSRQLLQAKFATKLPTPTGPVEGEFVLAQFNTTFADAPKSIETVTFSKESDGAWKCAGYYIKATP